MRSDSHSADAMKRRELANEIFVRAGTEFDESDDLTRPAGWLRSCCYRKCDRQTPSGIAANETFLHVHLIPLLGSKRLDAVRNEDVQRLKSHLKDRSPKTVNNVLAVLSVMLKKAVEWDVIERLPCAIRLLPIPKPSASFHDFDDYERLVTAAQDDPQASHRSDGR